MDRSEASSDRPQLLGGLSYYEYQQRLGRDVVIPWLDARLDLTGMKVGDFGAHQGGVLDAFREAGHVRGAVGLELSQEVVSTSPFVADDRFRLEAADVSTLVPGAYEFDLILLHDVLEHVPTYREALYRAARLLAPTGHIFISFPPYYSGFGGHQQLANGIARSVPFIHFLPSRLFYSLAQAGTSEYMSAHEAQYDMTSVRLTKLSLRRAERAFSDGSLEIVCRELFIVRPEYTVRYGLKVRRAGIAGQIPVLREIVVNGAFYLLRVRT